MLSTQTIQQLLPDKKIDLFGKDGLIMNSAPYYSISFFIFSAIFLLWNHAWIYVLIFYALLPLFDEIFTQDTRNPTEQERRTLENNDIYFRTCLYVTIAVDWALFFKTLKYYS